MKRLLLLPSLVIFALCVFPSISPVVAEPPRVGAIAPDFSLKTLEGETVHLKSLTGKGPVVLVVLRGWPGYQCPVCTVQVSELIGTSKAFQDAKAQIVLVYPGPAEKLKTHAAEFRRGKELPTNFHFILDPDYAFTNRYDLRWNASGETAYPSTFVIDNSGVITFAKVSRTHGGRAKPREILAVFGR